jgi:outer membrane protein TolC
MMRMMRRLTIVLMLLPCGCETARDVLQYVVMPEQRTISNYINPDALPSAPTPDIPAPRTVSHVPADTADWLLTLDDAVRISLENTNVVRVLTGTTVTTSGQTIYDAAITNTTIDQQQANFDPVLKDQAQTGYTNTPNGTANFTLASFVTGIPSNPPTLIVSQPYDQIQNTFGVTKNNVLGGQLGLNFVEQFQTFYQFNRAINPFAANYPLSPEQTSSVQLSYTQPFLQGAGFQVNMAPIVIARLNTQVSFFQYKDSVQEMVRSVADAYWQLVQNRTNAWARKIQVDQSEEAYKIENRRLKIGSAGTDKGTEAQAKSTYLQFKANLVAAEAAVLASEGTLRNLIGLPPSDGRRLVPISMPTSKRYQAEWDELVRLAERRRPDIIELKLIIAAEQQRLIQAENQALPQLNGIAQYQWNGLSGTMPNNVGESSFPGEFTSWTLGVNFSVPLSLRQARAMVRQERLIIEKDRANLAQGLHAAVHEIAATIRNLDSTYEQYLAFKDARAAADINVRAQNEKFKAGKTIYLNVLQALNDWGNAVTSEASSLLTYNTTLAILERQTGTILDSRGLVFLEERFRAAGPLGFERDYPASQPPIALPTPEATLPLLQFSEPAENFFDLRNPAQRDSK